MGGGDIKREVVIGFVVVKDVVIRFTPNPLTGFRATRLIIIDKDGNEREIVYPPYHNPWMDYDAFYLKEKR